MILHAKDREIDLSTPAVMGILNVTPDSFSDGGQHNTLEKAFERAKTMVEQGATIIDVGGYSTRPGCTKVSIQEELDRVVEVVEKIAKELDVAISVDTFNPEVMEASINAGAHIINDIKALSVPGAIDVCVKYDVPVCLMHMQGDLENMQEHCQYNDLLGDVNSFFFERIHECLNKGIKRNNIILDPGFGFSKNLEQNYELLGRLDTFNSFGLPILVGVSRKSMIGNLLNIPVEKRCVPSVALALYSVKKGAHILRVHDVEETVMALKVWMKANEFAHKKPMLDKYLNIIPKKKQFTI